MDGNGCSPTGEVRGRLTDRDRGVCSSSLPVINTILKATMSLPLCSSEALSRLDYQSCPTILIALVLLTPDLELGDI